MLKYCVEKWDKNKQLLEQAIKNKGKEMNSCGYNEIVEMTVEHIFNGSDNEAYDLWADWDIKKITQIDNGHYQGTQLYIIPLNTYQPSEGDYLMTYVGYGSCSGCDSLQSIQTWNDDEPLTNNQVKQYMMLCKDIVQNTIKPFNYGWRNSSWFDVVETEQLQ